ncbi:MAG: discoidin domain-containing protein [Stackebrandtia sp.]
MPLPATPSRRLAGILAVCGLAAASGCASAQADPVADVNVTFTLHEPADGAAKEGAATLTLTCDGQVAAEAELNWPDTPSATVPWTPGELCVVEIASEPQAGVVDEAELVVSGAAGAVERHTEFTPEGTVATREFVPQDGDLSVDATLAAHPEGEVGTPLKVMASNIWHGGTLTDHHDHDWAEDNRAQLTEFLRAENPDVLFVVETYGAADAILAALNEGQPDGREFTATRVTTSDKDNLWLFTWLDVEDTYVPGDGGDVSSFNFGGARLGLPDGSHVHAFDTWLTHKSEGGGSTMGAWTRANQAAIEEALGLDRSQTDEEILAADSELRRSQAREVIENELPYFVKDDAPVILGGDFNTQSPLDWTGQFAEAPGHEGLALDWPVMGAFDDAGFVDTFRHANPDAARYPGRTWSPAYAFGYAPGRIDYILAKGDGVRVLSSSTRTERMADHQGDEKDRYYPFYSDHGAVVTELLIRGNGTGPEAAPQHETPFGGHPEWPGPVAGTPVPPGEMTAEADSVLQGNEAVYAVDGDVRTLWHSDPGDADDPADPADPFPHNLTVDLGADRTLSGVRYVPRVDGGFNGLVVDYTVHASQDGENFEPVASGTWERSPVPKDIELDGISARYLRLEVGLGAGAFSHVAELIPYE